MKFRNLILATAGLLFFGFTALARSRPSKVT